MWSSIVVDPCEFQLLHPGLTASGRQKGCSKENYMITRKLAFVQSPLGFMEVLTMFPLQLCPVSFIFIPGLLNGEDFTSEVPLFLPPPIISRFHMPMKFKYVCLSASRAGGM